MLLNGTSGFTCTGAVIGATLGSGATFGTSVSVVLGLFCEATLELGTATSALTGLG